MSDPSHRTVDMDLKKEVLKITIILTVNHSHFDHYLSKSILPFLFGLNIRDLGTFNCYVIVK